MFSQATHPVVQIVNGKEQDVRFGVGKTGADQP